MVKQNRLAKASLGNTFIIHPLRVLVKRVLDGIGKKLAIITLVFQIQYCVLEKPAGSLLLKLVSSAWIKTREALPGWTVSIA